MDRTIEDNPGTGSSDSALWRLTDLHPKFGKHNQFPLWENDTFWPLTYSDIFLTVMGAEGINPRPLNGGQLH